MKTTLKPRMKDTRGFTLTELMMVIAIIMALLLIAGFNYKQWMDKYNIESQARTMHADLMQARVRAMEKNKQYFIIVSAGTYTVLEDTNENGAADPAPTDMVFTQKPLRYSSSWSGTLIIDQRGLISTSSSSLVAPQPITFNTGSVTPEYDCLQVMATRVHLGKNDGGGNCVPR